MSAVAAEKLPLRHVEELDIPPRDKIDEVLPFLTPGGKAAMLDEVLDALADTVENGDLRHVNHVIEAWYRTLLFKMNEEHEGRWKRAQELSDTNGMDIDEVSRRLNIG